MIIQVKTFLTVYLGNLPPPVLRNIESPQAPFRVLMVLQHDFEKPNKRCTNKVYELTISFNVEDAEAIEEELPGFISNSFYDEKEQELQVNAWVNFYLSQHTI